MGADPSNEDGDAGRPGRSKDDWTDAARARADRLHQRQPTAPPRERKAWFQHLPAKLAASVVFLVALTTLLGNLLELREKGRDVLPIPPPAAATGAASPQTAPATKPESAPAAPARMRVSLDRIAAQSDGSLGTTDWRFTVEADGQPLLAFGQDDLDDTGGRNVVRPKDVAASLRLAPGQRVKLVVKGWRLSRFRTQGAAPDAVGEGLLSADGEEAAIRIAASEPASGTFVLYFSADAPAR